MAEFKYTGPPGSAAAAADPQYRFYGTLLEDIVTDDDWVDMKWNVEENLGLPIGRGAEERIQIEEAGSYYITVSLNSNYSTADKIHYVRVQIGYED